MFSSVLHPFSFFLSIRYSSQQVVSNGPGRDIAAKQFPYILHGVRCGKQRPVKTPGYAARSLPGPENASNIGALPLGIS
jgi:hypothetical protein